MTIPANTGFKSVILAVGAVSAAAATPKMMDAAFFALDKH